MVSVVCLLAGFSKRMGKPKQHVVIKNQSFLEMIVSKIKRLETDMLIAKVIFVGQSDDHKARRLVEKNNYSWLNNSKPQLGPLHSLRLAVENIDSNSAVVIWPVDHPMVSLDTVKKILNASRLEPDLIIVPSDGSKRGHPAVFPAWSQKEFFLVPLDEGARAVLKQYPKRIHHIVVDDYWAFANMNSPDSLIQAQKMTLDSS